MSGVILYVGAGTVMGGILSIASHWLPRRRAGLATGYQALRADVGWPDLWLVMATTIGFAALWVHYGPSVQLAVLSLYLLFFLLIFVIDVAHRWVPNLLLLPAVVLALTVSLLTSRPSLASALAGGAVGFLWFYLIAIAYTDGLGAGDVKLAALIGLITGFPEVIVALSLGILIGGVVAAGLLLTGRKERKSHIPYAPFLVTGTLIDLVFGPDILAGHAALMGR